MIDFARWLDHQNPLFVVLPFLGIVALLIVLSKPRDPDDDDTWP